MEEPPSGLAVTSAATTRAMEIHALMLAVSAQAVDGKHALEGPSLPEGHRLERRLDETQVALPLGAGPEHLDVQEAVRQVEKCEPQARARLHRERDRPALHE